MSKCNNCGKELIVRTNYCAHCGNPTEETQNRKAVNVMTRMRALPDISTIKKGTVIDERYEITGAEKPLLFFIVFNVLDRQDNKMKRLSLIPPLLYNNAEAMDFLIQEYTSKLWLNSPNIIQIFSLQESGEYRYAVTEYFKGKSLSEVKYAVPEHRLPELLVLDMALQLVSALEYAHNYNVLSGLLYPETILINKNGEVKIDQFGMTEAYYNALSRMLNVSSSKSLMYLPPEQIEGKMGTIRSDIYGFGILLYELLSGNPPFYTGDIKQQILTGDVPEINDVSPEMNQLLKKCLSRDPETRFSQFSEIRNELQILREQQIAEEEAKVKEQTATQEEKIPESLNKDEAESADRADPPTVGAEVNAKAKAKAKAEEMGIGVKNFINVLRSMSVVYKAAFIALLVIIIAIGLLLIKPWKEDPARLPSAEATSESAVQSLDSLKIQYADNAIDYIRQGNFFKAETVLLAGLSDFPGDPALVNLTQKNLRLKHLYLQNLDLSIEILNGAGVGGIAKKLSDFIEQNDFKVINTENYRENGRINWQVNESFILNHFGYNYKIEQISKAVGIRTLVMDTLSVSPSGADIAIILGKDYNSLAGFR